MFRKKEKLQSYINQVWRLFKVALVMMLVLAVVLGNRYLEADAKTTMSEQELDSSLLSLSEVYLPGTIYDKKDNVLMFGSEPGKLSWMSDKKSNSLERLIGGTDYIKAVETGNVRMTILGMAPELLGESDSRMDEKSLFHPNQRRIGGNVKLTIDADLQNFIEDLLIENGYMDSSVMVSNFQTGEVEAAVCLGGDSSETVFSRKFHPASTMKLAIAASALEYDAKLANFSYTCKGNNTFTLDAEGKETVSVHCSGGNVHGTLTTMELAMAQSCNGYFIALAQQVPEEILRKNLKKFGFDDVMHFGSFKFNDNTFMGESENAYDLVYGCIGQGQASVTTIGLNMYTNAILNKGVLAEPHFILGSNDKREEPMKAKTQAVTRQMCTEEVADRIKNMMVKVMREGTGRDFAVDGVETAFKTGTGEEGDGKTQTLLVTGGILNENKPYSITVCLNHINGGSSVNAGLIAKEIINRLVTAE